MVDGAAGIDVTVVRCTPDGWVARIARVAAGATLLEAIRAAGLLAADDGAGESLDVGVFGHPRRLGDPVAEGDRIEIYRPLDVEPMAARRLRAAALRR